MAYTPKTWACDDTITADDLNHIERGIAESGGGGGLTEITYAELKALRDNGELAQGTMYKITDYVCTSTDPETQVESHPFDIIVVADSESSLNENALASAKADDAYYNVSGSTDAVLASWKLKYCIDNDTARFSWADTTNGKGVIYYMKDDKGNECYYDFKQIKFRRYEITAHSKVSSLVGRYVASDAVTRDMTVDENNPKYFFTFSGFDENSDAIIDNSIRSTSFVFDNYMGKHLDEDSALKPNNSIFIRNYCNSNTFGDDCNSNTFGNNCYSNTFGDGCYSNTFGDDCYSNTFGDDCNSNTFGDGCYSNTFGDDCNSNTFGNNCYSNTFGKNYYSNTFGNNCYSNTFGNNCKSNTFQNASATLSNPLRYYHVLDGTGGTQITTSVGNAYVTYVGKNSSGVLKYYCPMDSAA